MPAAANEFTAEFVALKTSMGVKFPYAWADPGDREEAWEITARYWFTRIQKRDACSSDGEWQ